MQKFRAVHGHGNAGPPTVPRRHGVEVA